MTSYRTNPDDGRGPLARPLAEERGMLLVIVMVILLVVSSLAGANLINAMLERNLARNQNHASIALQTAEAGIADGVTWLNVNQGLLPGASPWADNADWPREVSNGRAITRDLSRDLNADGDASDPGEQLGNYTVSMRYKREWRDYNGNGDCVDPGESSGYYDGDAQTPAANCPGDIVLFNKAAKTLDGGYGFTGSLFLTAGEGFPVVEIEAVGQYGNAGYRKVVLDVARNRFDVQVEGAFTARSGVTASGSSNVDGRNHTLAGALDLSGSCGGDKPSVTVDAGIPPPACGGNLFDPPGAVPCSATHDPMAPGKRPLEKTPWGVLGISEADFNGMFNKTTLTDMNASTGMGNTTCAPYQHNQWFAGTGGVHFNSSSSCSTYSGILVIHNENFDPDRWDPASPSYDAAYAANPANAPAVFDMNGNVTWTGVIIADQVVTVNGNPVIRGGIISLASGGVIQTSITGNIDIEYSCEAITGATNQGYKTRLGWHRLR